MLFIQMPWQQKIWIVISPVSISITIVVLKEEMWLLHISKLFLVVETQFHIGHLPTDILLWSLFVFKST